MLERYLISACRFLGETMAERAEVSRNSFPELLMCTKVAAYAKRAKLPGADCTQVRDHPDAGGLSDERIQKS